MTLNTPLKLVIPLAAALAFSHGMGSEKHKILHKTINSAISDCRKDSKTCFQLTNCDEGAGEYANSYCHKINGNGIELRFNKEFRSNRLALFASYGPTGKYIRTERPEWHTTSAEYVSTGMQHSCQLSFYNETISSSECFRMLNWAQGKLLDTLSDDELKKVSPKDKAQAGSIIENLYTLTEPLTQKILFGLMIFFLFIGVSREIVDRLKNDPTD